VKPVIVQPFGDNQPKAHLYYGQDVITTLRELDEGSVHTVCTSPPYWGLRDYGTGDAQIGLEETPEKYVGRMVEVFRQVARVLRPDGTLWLNLGDCFASTNVGNRNGATGTLNPSMKRDGTNKGKGGNEYRALPYGLKPKDLVGIPWRVAFALQADGWYLRSDIVWAKSACMPESVRDRPTKAHEYIFLFAHPESGGRYYYDLDAIREPHNLKYVQRRHTFNTERSENFPAHRRSDMAMKYDGVPMGNPAGRNKRSWWNINPKPYKGAHFAVWPPKLVEPMIRAGSSAKGACPTCGASWLRIVERVVPDDPGRGENSQHVQAADQLSARAASTGKRMLGSDYQAQLNANPPVTTGWKPTCECEEHEPVRSVVLDPFSGSATTGMVALQEGRDYIGIDLNEGYLELAEARVLGQKAPASGRYEGEVPDDLIGELFGD
jgi:DNA modification methylase